MTTLGAVGRGLSEVLNRWGTARGLDAPLDAAEPRARHYILAGVVSESFAYGPSILEVGCGAGATYAMLRRLRPVYRGIDSREAAIARCRERFGDDVGCSFEVGALDRFQPPEPLDVVIVNGALDALPFGEMRPALERATSMLQGPRSLLIVATARSPRASLVWASSVFLPEPTHRISVASRGARGGWTIRVYSRLRADRGQGIVRPASAPS